MHFTCLPTERCSCQNKLVYFYSFIHNLFLNTQTKISNWKYKLTSLTNTVRGCWAYQCLAFCVVLITIRNCWTSTYVIVIWQKRLLLLKIYCRALLLVDHLSSFNVFISVFGKNKHISYYHIYNLPLDLCRAYNGRHITARVIWPN